MKRTQLRRALKRFAAHAVECPRCGADPGCYCVQANGRPRMGYCLPRWSELNFQRRRAA